MMSHKQQRFNWLLSQCITCYQLPVSKPLTSATLHNEPYYQSCKSCLINHIESISHCQLIKFLGVGTCTHTDVAKRQFLETRHVLACYQYIPSLAIQLLKLIQLSNKTEQFGYKSGCGMCASKHLKCYNIMLVMHSWWKCAKIQVTKK